MLSRLLTLVSLTLLLVWASSLSALESVPNGIVAIPAEEAEEIGGAAVLIDDQGRLLTLEEAIPKGAKEVTVVLPGGQRGQARVLTRGQSNNAVLMQLVEGMPSHLKPLTITNPLAAQIGATAWTLGNPFNALEWDAQPAAARGIVSGMYTIPTGAPPVRGRGGAVLSTYRGPVLETSAAVNDGNQGGALIDDRGHLLGLVSMGVARERKMGTAIPIHIILDDLELELPMSSGSSPSHPVEKALAKHANTAAQSTVLVYFLRENGPGNPNALPRPRAIAETSPIYKKETLQKAWDSYYHQQQVFFTDQAIPAVVVDAENGWLLTAASNLHGGAETGTVLDLRSNGKAIQVSVHASHRPLDLVLLKADQPLPVPSATFAEEPLVTGDPIAVVGKHRDGGPFTMTTGVVSATKRRFQQSQSYFHQTDALANYASQGGPVVDLNGQIVGIMSMMAPRRDWPWFINSGVAMFADHTIISKILPQLQNGESQETPKMVGLGIQLTGPKGLVIGGVNPESGAADAGVKKGDILVKINKTMITSVADLRRALADKKAGDTVTLQVRRGGKIDNKNSGKLLDLTIELREL